MVDTLRPAVSPFSAPGHWYRGNLHTHTTRSDGEYSPQEAAAWYRQQGYDFLALTDHDVCTDVTGLSGPGFLVLPGIEVHPGRNQLGEPYHVLGLGTCTSHRYTRDTPLQEAIDGLRAEGCVVWLGHPYWLGLTLPEMIDCSGTIGIEIYNATCAGFGRGLSTVHWDDLLARGNTTWGLAVDDAHWVRGDYGRGWIMVKAPELTREAILRAVAAGTFYASQGPQIHDLQVTASEVYVCCSPVQTIDLVSRVGMGGNQAVAPAPDQPLTEFTFRRRYQEMYVRVECKDAHGRVAWSPPVPL